MSTLCRTIRSKLVQWRFELWLHSPFWHSHTNLISHRLRFLSLHCWMMERSWHFRWIGCYLRRRRIAGILQRFSRLRLLMDFIWLLLRAVFYFSVFPFIDVSILIFSVGLVVIIKQTSFFQDTLGVKLSTDFPIQSNDPKLHMVVYLQVAIISQALVFVTRSHSFFFVERPSTALMVAFVIAQLISSIIAAYGGWELKLFPVDGLESYGCGYVFFLWIYLLDTGLTVVI